MKTNIYKESSLVSKICIYGIIMLCCSGPRIVLAGGNEQPKDNLAEHSEQINISGRVLDETDQPLPGATVLEKGTDNGTITDYEGRFTLSVADDATLVISFVGYVQQEVKVNGATDLIIRLEADMTNLEEIVVVGYGTQIKRDVTGSLAQIDAQELAEIPVPSVAQQLQGRLVGVQINENSGEPGAALSFRVRGAASINAGNSPLIVIDGFPTTSGLETLSPNEIESISVLKDASASSLYGSRAANGVILVTTKQAKPGQKSIEFNAYTGIQVVPERGRPDLMNAREFAQFKKEYYEDAAIYEGYTGGVPQEYANPEQYGPNDGTDWFDILLRDALTQRYDLTIYTGTKDLKSVINLGYNNEEGVVLNSYSNRFNARANNIYNASDKLTLGVNLSISHIRSQVIPGIGNGRNILANAFNMDPTIEYRNEDGTYPISFSRPGMFPNPNYYLVVTQRKNPRKETALLANLFGQYEITDGLKYKLSINANTGNTITRSFTPSTARGGLGNPPPQPPIGSYGTGNFQNWLVENTLNYNKTFNEKHNVEALIGYTSQYFSNEYSGINASEFPDDEIEWINVATIRIGETTGPDGVPLFSESSLLSYLGRLNYNYDGKYLLSLAFRRDGSSRFGSDTKWGNFPSVSLGWVLSDEGFMSGIENIDLLKLRASYGKVGNNNIGDYTYLASLSTDNYVFGGQVVAGRSLNGIGNANLTWETTTSYNLGLDLDLFGGRVSFTYDYYWKKTDGLLYGVDIPIQSGFNNITSNIGEFNFWGHEFSVFSRNLTGKLKWNTNFNISFDRNKVIKLGTNDAPIGGYNLFWDDNRTAVGQPIGLFYGFINTGVYMTQEEFDTQPVGATSMVGTARFADISGPDGVPDGIIDAHDRTFIGDPNPDFIYGITNNLSYGNIDLSIVMAGTVGNDISDNHYQSSENFDGVFNIRRGYADRWRSLENPGSGHYPRTRAGTTADYRNFTDRQVFKGTYLAVKNITLAYNIPLQGHKFIKTARVNISTRNPFIFTKYPGMNPEVGIAGLNGLNQGRDFTSYPIARIYTLGLNVGF